MKVRTDCQKTCPENEESPLSDTNPIDPDGGGVNAVDVTVETCSGSFTQTAQSTVQALIPMGTVLYTRRCPDDTDEEHAILCAPDGTRVIVVNQFFPGNPEPTTTAYNITGGVYTGDLSLLQECEEDDNIESDAIEWCAGGTDYIQWIVKNDGVPTGEVYWTNALTGAVVAQPAGAVRGSCSQIGLLTPYTSTCTIGSAEQCQQVGQIGPNTLTSGGMSVSGSGTGSHIIKHDTQDQSVTDQIKAWLDAGYAVVISSSAGPTGAVTDPDFYDPSNETFTATADHTTADPCTLFPQAQDGDVSGTHSVTYTAYEVSEITTPETLEVLNVRMVCPDPLPVEITGQPIDVNVLNQLDLEPYEAPCATCYRYFVSTNRGGWGDPRSNNFSLAGLGSFDTSAELVTALENAGYTTDLYDAGSGTGDTSWFTVCGGGDPGPLTWNPFAVDGGATTITAVSSPDPTQPEERALRMVLCGTADVNITNPTLDVNVLNQPDPPAPENHVPRIAQFSGTDTVQPPARTESFTITILQGTVTVADGVNQEVELPAGSSWTWGQGDTNYLDNSNFKMAGTSAQSRYILHWEEV